MENYVLGGVKYVTWVKELKTLKIGPKFMMDKKIKISFLFLYFIIFFFYLLFHSQLLILFKEEEIGDVYTPFCSRGDLNPKSKGLGSLHLPSGLICHCYIICTKLIYTWTHYIKKILKKYFKEQINYNYFIIKYKIFF